MEGFLDLKRLEVIDELPTVIGVQSHHADPVYRWNMTGKYAAVPVTPSVAQAAMIGNPVSMPRVIHLVEQYNALSDRQNVFFVEVSEQAIMDWELKANRNGHIACTHGGESLAGLVQAIETGDVKPDEIAVVDSTAHALKFSGFQDMYFTQSFPSEFKVTPNPALINAPVYVHPPGLEKVPQPGKPLNHAELKQFVQRISDEIAAQLTLRKIDETT
jgi:threonine synthase